MVGSLKVVQCHGVFDVFHYGHLIMLQFARTLGDCLIVTVTADRYVFKEKNRPVFKQHQRIAMLRAVSIVDDVRLIDEAGPEAAIKAVRPSIYVKGKEYEGALPEQQLVESFGGRVVFHFDGEASVIRTTKILRHYHDAGDATRDS